MIKLFNNCPNRDCWHLQPPKTEEVFHDEYLKKRGWYGTLVWINSLVAVSFLLHEENPVKDLQDTARSWLNHYNVNYIEQAISFWCQEHCIGRWDKFFIYGVEFEKEEDAILFKLQWTM